MKGRSKLGVRRMIGIVLAIGLVVPALVLAAAAAKPAANKPQTATMKTDAAHDAAMEEMMKLGKPGPEHAGLEKMAGTWKAVNKSWFVPGEPTVNEGTAESRMILGGRFLEQKFHGTMMGQAFEGYGLTGYDNVKKTYTTMWIDNMGTYISTGTGSMDAAGKELTMKSMMPGPDGKPIEHRMVTKVVDDKTHVFSMYAPYNGKEQLMMEITYTRM
ncbi:MAG TPA: DUF1579 domain-containing protein [Candidatus Limnocylindria bacterium]|nr:DUF1579 domain-containing protein [Candidatus Limnocylindria bacterium]